MICCQVGYVFKGFDMFQYFVCFDLLKDCVILVIGVGCGIGVVVVKIFVVYGVIVLLLGKIEEYLNEVYDVIEVVGYLQVVVILFNLEIVQLYQFEELVVILENEFGCIDGLLYNVLIFGLCLLMQQIFGENFMCVMQVNVNVMFMLIIVMLLLMKFFSDVLIIFILSSVGWKGCVYWGVYLVLKFVIEGLMQIFVDEFDGISVICVNSVNFGVICISMCVFVYFGENLLNNFIGEEIMLVYLYFMGLDSVGVNGQVFDVQ